jgi:hypothetical protein
VRRPAVLAATFLLLCALFFAIAGCGGKADSAKPGPIKSWGKGGVVRFGNFEADKMIEDGAGRVLVLGLYDDRIAEIVRLLPDGSLDASFGKGGVVRWPYRMFADRFRFGRHFLGWDLAAFLPGGKIALAGTSNFGDIDEQSTLIVSEIDESGHVISNFGENGYFVSKTSNHLRGPTGMAVQNDRLVLAVHRFRRDDSSKEIVLMRLRPDGTLDSSFGGDGKTAVLAAPGYLGLSTPILALPNKRLAIATVAPVAKPGLARIVGLLENGTRDLHFGRQGFASTRVSNNSYGIYPYGLFRSKRGRLALTGSTSTGPFVACFDVEGSADDFWRGSQIGDAANVESFGGAFGSGAITPPTVIAQRASGGFVAAGAILARIRSYGVLDASYPTQPLFAFVDGKTRNAWDLLVASDDTVLVMTRTGKFNRNTLIARYR